MLTDTLFGASLKNIARLFVTLALIDQQAIKHTAHHMLLYGCEKPGTMEDLWNCGEMNSSPDDPLEHHQPCKKGSQILYGWAMDAPDLTLPEGVGFR